MNHHYNQNYTKEEIVSLLRIIKDCVRKNRYSISKNDKRQENISFISEYNLTFERKKEILLRINPDDFCHSLQNVKPGFEHEVLYVFCPQVKLLNFEGNEEIVDIYTKFNIIENDKGQRVVVISFHKRNKPIRYLFR